MRHVFDDDATVSYRARIRNNDSIPTIASAKCPLPLTSASVECFAVESDQEQPQAIMLRAVLPDAKFFGCEDLQWTSKASSAKECEEEQIVLYRTGEGDPAQVIAEALARGASGILTEQILPCPIPQCVVGNVDRALATITRVVFESPDRKLLTVGFLGTSGKTSTCLLAATVTGAMGIRTAYQCDLGSSDGVLSDTACRAVPHGADLVEWLAEANDCSSRAALIEIDESAARDGHYDAIRFDVLIVAGRSERASDFGPCGLNSVLDRLTEDGVVIAPAADTKAIRVIESNDCQYVTYGTSQGSDFNASLVEQSGGMTTLMLSSSDTNVMMETPLCGPGMAANIAAAAAFAGLLGHALHDTAKDLATLRSIPGRGQRLVEFGCPTVVIESGGAADRVALALKTAKAVGVGGKVWCVFAISDQDDAESLAAYGHAVERHAHHCVVTARRDATESFLKRSHQLLDGVQECAAMRLVADQAGAIQWALGASGPRDTIVVVTNQPKTSAAQIRGEIDELARLVDSLRVADEESHDVSTGSPISLKLFPSSDSV